MVGNWNIVYDSFPIPTLLVLKVCYRIIIWTASTPIHTVLSHPAGQLCQRLTATATATETLYFGWSETKHARQVSGLYIPLPHPRWNTTRTPWTLAHPMVQLLPKERVIPDCAIWRKQKPEQR